MINLTPKAVAQVEKLLMNREGVNRAIRIGVKTKGCSGLSYTLEFVDETNAHDEKIKFKNFDIYIDPKATFFLLGTEMDFIEDELQSGFEFKNPNEKGRCGCGESFHI